MRSGRRRIFALASVLGMVATMVFAAPAAAEVKIPASQGAPDETLLARYHIREKDDGKFEKSIDRMMYMPRQFVAGTDVDPDTFRSTVVENPRKYQGWDILAPPYYSSDARGAKWLRISLNRDAMVAIVWRDTDKPRPSWLTNRFKRSGSVVIDGREYPVFKKRMKAGGRWLGGPSTNGSSVRNYLVLVGEENGSPTPPPPVPAGKPAPAPNQLCPQWLHDQHTTVGWDGETYGTWHPQIDPMYWCYYGHEHGSNPSIIPGAPKVPYQYVADKVPQNEPEIGFKEFIFEAPSGHFVRIIDHISTAHHRRVCARFHTVYAIVYDAKGVEKFRAGFKADFGASISAEDNSTLTPSNCGYNMESLRAGTPFFKRIRRNADSGDYETWKSGTTPETTNLGMVFNHSFDTRDPYTFCPTQDCDSTRLHDEERRQDGTRRTLNMHDFVFDSSLALGTGKYYTDPFGTTLLPSDSPNAVEQFAAPGFRLSFERDGSLRCAVIDPWTYEFSCDENLHKVPRVDLEGGLEPMGDGELPDIDLQLPTCNGVLATVVGTSGDDTLVGSPFDDVIVGLGGNDVIDGGGGNDLICGGGGNDELSGGAGRDILHGNGGRDRLNGGNGADALLGGAGRDKLFGNDGDDVLAGQRGDDVLKGQAGPDLLFGGPGADTLVGGRGSDALRGQSGTDTCTGSGGDRLVGCE